MHRIWSFQVVQRKKRVFIEQNLNNFHLIPFSDIPNSSRMISGLPSFDESIEEESDTNMEKIDNKFAIPSNQDEFVWRIDLSRTEQYWQEWFNNLSKIFLGKEGGAKLLLLAGVDRLDGPMTVGQMQGKFQMQILPRVGHVIQEDDPDSVAHVVASYLIRNRFSTSKADFDYPFPSC